MIEFDIHLCESTESTNEDVRKAAEAGAPQGTVVWALSQTAGKGRQGRAWFSPAGNLYFSVLLRPETELKNYWQFSFLTALAISDLVRSLLPDKVVELKWPNDVLINGKKASGILLESGSHEGKGWLVIGVGLNVEHFPENPLYPVTSLQAEGVQGTSLVETLNTVLLSLSNWCDIMANLGFATVRAAWLGRARKGPMRVKLPEGDIAGEFKDLDEKGNLTLILPDGSERCVITGDVLF